MDRRGVVERGLPAAVGAGHCGPHAHGTPEVVRHVQRHHVLHAQTEGGRAFDLIAGEVAMGMRWVGRVDYRCYRCCMITGLGVGFFVSGLFFATDNQGGYLRWISDML